MRKGLAVGAALASVVVAGCGSSSGGPAPKSPKPTPPTQSGPQRTAPTKSLDVVNQCSLVTSQQAQQLGLTKPPKPRNFDQVGVSVPVCAYHAYSGNVDYSAGMGVIRQQSTQQFVEQLTGDKPTTLDGYPGAVVAGTSRDCLLSLDINDQGSLFVSTYVQSGPIQPCGLAKDFARAALKNLPNE